MSSGVAAGRPEGETLRSAFNRIAAQFSASGIDSAMLDARLLVCHATGLSHEHFIAEPGRPLGTEETRSLADLAARRLAGWPVARLTGFKEFWGRDFALSPETLVPRPDSELLVETGLAHLAQGAGAGTKRIADLGTGSGCLLVSLLADCPEARGVGFDMSPGALFAAAANADRFGVADRALFVRADWLEAAAPASFDLVVANPPYIASSQIDLLAREVAEHDPRGALDGGPDGLAAYRRIAAQARDHLSPGGVLLAEVGESQAAAVAGLFSAHGLAVERRCDILCDIAGIERVVRAVRPK